MDALSGSARCALDKGNPTLAEDYSRQVYSYLEQSGSEALEFPILAYLTCARVFEKTGDQERRQKSIQSGHRQLLKRVNKISDPSWEKTYLENITENIFISRKFSELSKGEKSDAFRNLSQLH
jgi:hypothetical protein